MGGIDWPELEKFVTGMQTTMNLFIPLGDISAAGEGAVDLLNIFKGLYKASDKSPGGTAGAIRLEIEGNGPTGGKFHLQKGAMTIRALQKWLAKYGKTADPKAVKAANDELNNLINAYQGQNWENYINNYYPPITFDPTNALSGGFNGNGWDWGRIDD
jgi:hypothetical protein